jgi:hypothetical protein
MFGYTFKKFSKSEWIFLLSFTLCTGLCASLNYYFGYDQINIFLCTIMFIGPWRFMDVWFRNSLFSAAWLLILVLYYFQIRNFSAQLPILSFGCYQLTRTIFWLNNKKEFIPTLFGWIRFRPRYSKILQRNSADAEAVYSVILFFSFVFASIIWGL